MANNYNSNVSNAKVKKKNSKEKNELIIRRRRKKRLKNSIILIVLLISIGVTLCLKLTYFNIKNINISNNRNISSNEIKKLSNITLGKNIFYINVRKSKANILANPYILNVNIKRKIPNTINISVEERIAVFYIKKGEKYLVIDKDGVVLEEKELINNMKLIKLEGVEPTDYTIGNVLNIKDTRKIEIIGKISELVQKLNKNVPEPAIVNISDVTNINMSYGDILVKLGTDEELEKKYNEAINIFMYNNLESKKGYIDVSFDGDPVFFVKD